MISIKTWPQKQAAKWLRRHNPRSGVLSISKSRGQESGLEIGHGGTIADQLRFTLQLTVVLSMSAALYGCGGGHAATVSGNVTLNGQPLTRGMVSFYPAQGPAAVGSVKNDGSYAISTGRGEGLDPGEYTVTVFANEPPPLDESIPGKIITPEVYNDKATSPLKFTVKAGSNVIHLELTGSPPDSPP